MTEKNIKRALRLNLLSGCPVTYNEVKDTTMRIRFACQLGRMHAFTRLAVTGKDYTPLECIAVDYKGPICSGIGVNVILYTC